MNFKDYIKQEFGDQIKRQTPSDKNSIIADLEVTRGDTNSTPRCHSIEKNTLEVTRGDTNSVSRCHLTEKNTRKVTRTDTELSPSDTESTNTELQVTRGDAHIKETLQCVYNLLEYPRHLVSLRDTIDGDEIEVLRATCVEEEQVLPSDSSLSEESTDVSVGKQPVLGTNSADRRVTSCHLVSLAENDCLDAGDDDDDDHVTDHEDDGVTSCQLVSLAEFSDLELQTLRGSSTIALSPIPIDLAYAHVQLFHNSTRTSRSRSEWVVKLRCTSDSALAAGDFKLVEYFVSFAVGGPRRLRAKINRWISKGHLTEAFLARFDHVTSSFNPNVAMGLVSKSAVIGPVALKGQSSNARVVYDDQFATLTLDRAGNPYAVSLYLAPGMPPIVLNDFKPADRRTQDGGLREKSAATHYTYFDPDGRFLQLRAKGRALAQYNANQQDLVDQHPINSVAEMVSKPLKERIDRLENMVRELAAWNTELETAIRNLKETQKQ